MRNRVPVLAAILGVACACSSGSSVAPPADSGSPDEGDRGGTDVIIVVDVRYDSMADNNDEAAMDLPPDPGDLDTASGDPEAGEPDEEVQDPGEPGDPGQDDGGPPDLGPVDEGPCVPNCRFEDGTEKVCGPDGCGGICGYCEYGKVCKEWQCVDICIPDCISKDKLCGPDGCGGECPPGCDEGFECRDDFRCYPVQCIPDCTGRVCGHGAGEGCGNPVECGECGPGQSCTDLGQCVEGPCMGIHPDKGKCLDPYTVGYCTEVNGQEVLIKVDCTQEPDKVCGWDPWEGKFACVDKPPCVPKCTLDDGTQKECGDDGCGGQCGSCPIGWGCPSFRCRPVPGASCGWITEVGTCWYDNWLYYCTGPVQTGQIGAEDCTAQGKVCAYDDKFSHTYQCMTPL